MIGNDPFPPRSNREPLVFQLVEPCLRWPKYKRILQKIKMNFNDDLILLNLQFMVHPALVYTARLALSYDRTSTCKSMLLHRTHKKAAIEHRPMAAWFRLKLTRELSHASTAANVSEVTALLEPQPFTGFSLITFKECANSGMSTLWPPA